MSIFSERLRYHRKLLGKSQREIAESIGVNERQYRRYESGEQEPTLSNAARAADALSLSLDYLAGRTGQSQRK